jgi:polyhydroxyalkanoate synthesis repressor PhaR
VNSLLVIKRYPNRKLYDTEAKGYITLEQIARLIRAGQEIQVIDNVTGEDLTAVVLTQIILEQEKKQSGFIPSAILAGLVQSGGRTLHSLRQSLMNPRELLQQVDTEIDLRIQHLISRGELAEEEALRWREKLISLGTEDDNLPPTIDPESLAQLLKERGVPGRDEIRMITEQLAALASQIDDLQADLSHSEETNLSAETGNFSPQGASNE